MSNLIRIFPKFSGVSLHLSGLAVTGISVLLLTGCAGPAYLEGDYSGYSGPYYDSGYPGPYAGPYYGDFGPYEDVYVGGGGWGGTTSTGIPLAAAMAEASARADFTAVVTGAAAASPPARRLLGVDLIRLLSERRRLFERSRFGIIGAMSLLREIIRRLV